MSYYIDIACVHSTSWMRSAASIQQTGKRRATDTAMDLATRACWDAPICTVLAYTPKSTCHDHPTYTMCHPISTPSIHSFPLSPSLYHVTRSSCSCNSCAKTHSCSQSDPRASILFYFLTLSHAGFLHFYLHRLRAFVNSVRLPSKIA